MSAPPGAGAGASASSSSKRHSILPPVSSSGPRAPVVFPASTSSSSLPLTISESAILIGSNTIMLGADSVIHPRARIESAEGNVVIGRRCIVSERSIVGAAGSAAAGQARVDRGDEGGVLLGDYVRIEVGAVVEAGGTVIGDGCTLGVGSRVGKGAVLGKYCTLTPRASIAPGETVPEYTVVYSNNLHRADKREISDQRNKAMVREIEVLRRLIPSNPAKFQ